VHPASDRQANALVVALSAVALGVGVLLAGNLPWGVLFAPVNLRVGRAVPWAIVPTALYLWAYWQFIGGRWGAPSTAATRRARLRANPVAPEAWLIAIIAGLVGFGGLIALLSLMARLMVMPGSTPIQQPADMPAATAFALVVMSSVVAGVTEEAAFRGYMQGPIEQRSGLAAGILVNGTMFGLLHYANHPAAVLSMLPYYISVAAVYGGITWAADSILPVVALHVGGDVWSLTRMWTTGRAEWQLSEAARPTVWTTGPDVSFVATLLAVLALATVTAMLCRHLRRLTVESGFSRTL
jgi:membrane protease YdiL (CAAX protease family)